VKGGAAMTKQELIEIVQSMDHDTAFRSYYQFAHTYLQHMLNSGITDTNAFWNVVKHCQQTANSSNTKQALGISGAGRPEDIKRWCGYLLNHKDLVASEPDELCSIFGYCAHLGK
jgi:hypothetical protein